MRIEKLALTLLLGTICGVGLGMSPAAFAAEGSDAAVDVRHDKHAAYKGSKGRKAAAGEDDYDTLTLDMVRDVGVSLRQVKDLSIYIFREATRTTVTSEDPATLEGFDKISEKDIDANAKYLRPRAGWIFFYVGTLEPTIQLLKDAESERIYIPKKIKNEAVKLSENFDKELDKTKREIKKLHRYIDGDPHESTDVARAALAIYDSAQAMEKIRLESYEIVRDAEKKGYKDMVLF